MKRVGILTGGGDVPGLNAAIKAFVWRMLDEPCEIIGLRREATALKEVVADLTLENRLLKKSMIADGGDDE